ncbi:MAG: DUF2510 domain-containing protein [Acidimicrobiales bacterium]
MGTHLLAALGSSTKAVEVVILAVVIILLATILLLYRKNSRPAKAGANGAAQAASYYGDMGTVPAHAPSASSMSAPSNDPFAGFGGAVGQGSFGQPQPAPAPPPPPPAPAASPTPPPGTPAGWLPDPSGAPDTLRYWDGAGWTQHVARRN